MAPPSSRPEALSSHTERPSLSARVLHAFHERFDGTRDTAPVVTGRAPGRVNLLGDHTDYTGGFVLPATLGHAVCVALHRRADQGVHLYSLDFDEEVTYSLAESPAFESLPMWARYAAGVAEELRRRSGLPVGFEGAIGGDVPLGAGLSSSAALEVAMAVTLDGLFDLALDPVETARLCQHVEHEYVGTKCGIMDQFASRLGRPGHVLFLDCRTLDYEHIPLPLQNGSFDDGDSGEASLVIADTGVSRELADSKYNERRAECEEAARFFQQFDEEVETLRDVSQALLEKRGADLPAALLKRARHVVTENRRVEDGAEALRAGRLNAFGELMSASHESLRDDYEVSSAELDALVEAAQGTKGVLGARMTGAGFGGCTVALARREAVPALRRHLETRYQERFERRPEVYVVERNLEAGLL